jgi:hypothetical protein
MHTFECDLPFCSNPECALHLGRGAAGVRGRGNWARLDGRWVGRSTYCGVFLCDECCQEWRAVGAIFLDGEILALRGVST